MHPADPPAGGFHSVNHLPAASARPRSRGTSAHHPGCLVHSRDTALASPALSHTQIVFLNVPYSRPYRKIKKCPPVVRRGTKKSLLTRDALGAHVILQVVARAQVADDDAACAGAAVDELAVADIDTDMTVGVGGITINCCSYRYLAPIA